MKLFFIILMSFTLLGCGAKNMQTLYNYAQRVTEFRDKICPQPICLPCKPCDPQSTSECPPCPGTSQPPINIVVMVPDTTRDSTKTIITVTTPEYEEYDCEVYECDTIPTLLPNTTDYLGVVNARSAMIGADETRENVQILFRDNVVFVDSIDLGGGFVLSPFTITDVTLMDGVLTTTSITTFTIPSVTVPQDFLLIGGRTFRDVPVTVSLVSGHIIDDRIYLALRASGQVRVLINMTIPFDITYVGELIDFSTLIVE